MGPCVRRDDDEYSSLAYFLTAHRPPTARSRKPERWRRGAGREGNATAPPTPTRSLRLAGELLHRGAELIGQHRLDDPGFLGIELLFGRRHRGLVDQRLGAADG